MWVSSAEWSRSPRPLLRRAWSIWSTAAVLGNATPYSRAVASAMPRSLWCRSMRNPGVKSCSRKLRPRTSMTLLAARPPLSTSMIVAGSTPAFEPRTSASETASIVSATTTWLHALTTWPAPTGPTWTIVLPSASHSGFARAKSSSRPPAMIESVASRAPTSPPLTGASTQPIPRAPHSCAISRVTTGEIVLMSTTSEPDRAPASRPSSPSRTSRTWGESGSMRITTSAFSATSRALDAATPPSAAISSTLARVRENRTSSWPAFIRLRAMGLPMTPRPTKPTRSFAIRRSSPASTRGSPRWWRGRVVLEADPAVVAEAVDRVEDEREVDLARARLAAPGRVGDLDVGDAREVLLDRRDEVPLHALHVVRVVLEAHVGPVDAVDELRGLPGRVDEVRAVLERVDGLDRDRDPVRGGLVGGPADVLGGERELLVARGRLRLDGPEQPDLLAERGGLALEPDERVHALAAEPPGEVERDRHVLAEAVLAVAVAEQAPVAFGHLAGVEVEQRDLQVRLLDRRLDLVERLAGGPPELHGVEARRGGALEALQEGRVLEQDRDVGAELHSSLLVSSV